VHDYPTKPDQWHLPPVEAQPRLAHALNFTPNKEPHLLYPLYLTHDEIERRAFVAGDGLIALLAETAHDLQQENLDYANKQESLKTASFELGKFEGLGEDVQAAMTSLNAQVSSLQQHLTTATELLGTCHAWLQGEQTKTVKGRREAAQSLAARMALQGLGHPRHPQH